MPNVFSYVTGFHRDVAQGTLLGLEVLQNTLNRLGVPIRRRAKLPKTLAGKVVVITGANTGIGKETAKVFVQLGAKVIIGCRDVGKARQAVEDIRNQLQLDDAANDLMLILRLDLSSLASVRSFAKEIGSMVSSVDYLINNAGVMWCPPSRSVDGYELHLATNFLSHFLLTHLLFPLLQNAAQARILNVSSLTYVQGKIHFDNINLVGYYNKIRAYAQSKLAINLITGEMARRLRGTNITVYCLHPGIIQTELTRHLTLLTRLVLMPNNSVWYIDAELGAQTTLHCAFEANVKSGAYYE